MQYRLGGRGSKKERVTLGECPAHTLGQARLWREQCRAMIAHGQFPAAARQAERESRSAHAADSVAAFANLWYSDIVSRTNSEPRNIRRVLDKDVLPAIGDKPVADVTIPDILAITDAVKARGADQMALQTRNVIKRLYAYAIARGKTRFNPAAAIEARIIATARSRDVALSRAEIGQLLRGIYQSSIRRPYKLALHLLVLCMVRKGELIGARWEEINFDKAEYRTQRREMLQWWADLVDAQIEERRKVVIGRFRKAFQAA